LIINREFSREPRSIRELGKNQAKRQPILNGKKALPEEMKFEEPKRSAEQNERGKE